MTNSSIRIGSKDDISTSMTNKPLEEVYFKWLCNRIDPEFGHNTTRTYHDLFAQLHEKEFVWIIPNDDNRVHDGLELRIRFIVDNGYEGLELYSKGIKGASCLEVLIALSVRLEFQADGRQEFWAWQLIENLGLNKFKDPVTPRKAEQIDEILNTLIWRTYGRDGVGSFFPLAWPDVDKNMAEIEIWYQMAAYVNEIHIL